MKKVLELLVGRLQEAHDTHIYDTDDPHPEDCTYCEAIWEGEQAIARLADEDAVEGGAQTE